ncbi:MAG: hypothetical protein ABSA05_06580 [Opitutaceae bacterium]|jgi:hypothetical protein
MKDMKRILFGALAVSGLLFLLAGCIGPGGGGGGWYHDGPWMDGPRFRGGIDIHPPGFRR